MYIRTYGQTYVHVYILIDSVGIGSLFQLKSAASPSYVCHSVEQTFKNHDSAIKAEFCSR